MNESVVATRNESRFTIPLKKSRELDNAALLIKTAHDAVTSGIAVVVDNIDPQFLCTAGGQILVSFRRKFIDRKLTFDRTSVQDSAQTHHRRAGQGRAFSTDL